MSKIIYHSPLTASENAAAHDARGAEPRGMTQSFRTHTGEIVTGERLQVALNAVADDWARMAHAIRNEDAYADHVTEAEKAEDLVDGLAYAERIRRGDVKNFTVWQRVDTELTGQCVALLA